MEGAPINVESPAHYQALLNQHKRYFLKQIDLKQIDEEREFLDETGVRPEIMTYGFLSQDYEAIHTADNHHYSVWTFSVEDMGKLGVSNFSYEGDGEYPSDLTLESYPTSLFYRCRSSVIVVIQQVACPTHSPRAKRVPGLCDCSDLGLGVDGGGDGAVDASGETAVDIPFILLSLITRLGCPVKAPLSCRHRQKRHPE